MTHWFSENVTAEALKDVICVCDDKNSLNDFNKKKFTQSVALQRFAIQINILFVHHKAKAAFKAIQAIGVTPI